MELYYIGITPLGQSPYLWLYTKLYKHILSRGKKNREAVACFDTCGQDMLA